jgi:hypothetical protein
MEPEEEMKGKTPAVKTWIGSALLAVGLVCLLAPAAQAQDWEPITGAQALRDFMSGRTVTWSEGPATRRGEYRADGTGTLYAWGTSFDRTWSVEGDEQMCIQGEPESLCYTLERSTTDPSLYRVTEVASGEAVEIRDAGPGGTSVAAGPPGATGKASADELTSKLLNPANPIMKVGNNFEYQRFDGELPGASDQSSFKYIFLTVFPFKLSNGNSILVRPGIPVLFDQPLPTPSGEFDSVGVNLGDTGMDVLYSGTTKGGTIWGFGAIMTLPTATHDSLGKDLFSIGPEVVFGKAGKWGAAGGVLGHQWDVAGSGAGKTNLTTLNYFYGIALGNGWALSSAPIISYNHEAPSSSDAWSVPLGFGVSKTVSMGSRPVQFILQYWYHAVRPDAFAPKHTVRLSILPVFSAPWNKGK